MAIPRGKRRGLRSSEPSPSPTPERDELAQSIWDQNGAAQRAETTQQRERAVAATSSQGLGAAVPQVAKEEGTPFLQRWSGTQANTRELTAQDVAGMDPTARSRVQLNTALLQASTDDKAQSAILPDRDSNAYKEYQATAARLFGEAQETYAPNTLALLDALGAKNLQGMSIDDFLSLDAVAEQLEQGQLATGVLAPSNPQHDRNLVLDSLTQGVQNLSQIFESGTKISTPAGSVPAELAQLGSTSRQLNAFANPAAVAYGGERYTVPTSSLMMDSILGTDSAKSATFDTAFAAAAVQNPSVPFSFDELMGALRAEGYDPQEFLQYAGERLAVFDDQQVAGSQAGASLVPGYTTIAPAEVRKLLGLVTV